MGRGAGCRFDTTSHSWGSCAGFLIVFIPVQGFVANHEHSRANRVSKEQLCCQITERDCVPRRNQSQQLGMAGCGGKILHGPIYASCCGWSPRHSRAPAPFAPRLRSWVLPGSVAQCGVLQVGNQQVCDFSKFHVCTLTGARLSWTK
jgi:hypothetical protein